MDYKHIYLEIIRRAKNEQIIGNRPLNIYYRRRDFKDDYFEFHHILPKSIFPKFKNIKKNLVPLTAREHFICHKLLLKIYPGKSMAFALIRLCFKRPDLKPIVLSAREYEQIRKNVSYYIAEFNKGKTLSNETKLKISEILKEKYKNGDYISHNKNNNLSDETKNKISNSLKEQYNTGKIEVWNKNKKCPSSIRLKEKNKMYGKHWFTNGNDNIIAEECPESYKPGKTDNITEEVELKRKRKISENSKGRHWYNNGKINKFCYECPAGFVKGFLDPRWIKNDGNTR